MLELFWSRLSSLLGFLATNYQIQNAITLSQIVSSWLYFWPISGGIADLHGALSMASGLYKPLAIGPLVHLAIAQPLEDTLAGKIPFRVLAGHLVYLGSSQYGGRLFIMSFSHGGSACG